MGRKTFESLGRPTGLPNRHNLILSKSLQPQKLSFGEIISSLDFLPDLARELNREVWVIGGSEIYGEVLLRGLVSEIQLTLVACKSGADVLFPAPLHDLKAFAESQLDEVGARWIEVSRSINTSSNPSTTYIQLNRA